jgi:hypothetical protein
MSVSELFYQSAVVNSLVFLWLASAVSATRIFFALREKKSLNRSFWAYFFGPLAFIAAWLFEAYFFKIKNLCLVQIKARSTFDPKSPFLLNAGLTLALFHWLFVYEFARSTTSSEVLILRIGLFF